MTKFFCFILFIKLVLSFYATAQITDDVNRNTIYNEGLTLWVYCAICRFIRLIVISACILVPIRKQLSCA